MMSWPGEEWVAVREEERDASRRRLRRWREGSVVKPEEREDREEYAAVLVKDVMLLGCG